MQSMHGARPPCISRGQRSAKPASTNRRNPSPAPCGRAQALYCRPEDGPCEGAAAPGCTCSSDRTTATQRRPVSACLGRTTEREGCPAVILWEDGHHGLPAAVLGRAEDGGGLVSRIGLATIPAVPTRPSIRAWATAGLLDAEAVAHLTHPHTASPA